MCAQCWSLGSVLRPIIVLSPIIVLHPLHTALVSTEGHSATINYEPLLWLTESPLAMLSSMNEMSWASDADWPSRVSVGRSWR